MEPRIQGIRQLAKSLAKRQPSEIIEYAIENHSGRIGISFSGAEDVVLIDMAAKLGGKFRVFSLDTGRLHAETYQFIDQVREHYGLPVEIFFPQPDSVQNMVRTKGLFSFYEDGHKECCGVRKVEPLKRALGTFNAWMTGLRRDQSPSTRA